MGARHVYVHVPFCARRCSYCDFAIAVRRHVPTGDFLAAIAREMDLRLARDAGAPAVETLYLGGGTPSRLGAEGVSRLLELVHQRLPLVQGAEVTLEANPEDVTPASAAAWRRAGINRISLGVQSFHDDVLRWMHRTHGAAQVESAALALRDAGIDDWSLDLIFALPSEVRRSWTSDLERAVSLEPSHISCYGLTVEPHTPLVRWRERGQVHEAEEERYEAEFLEADRRLTAAGFTHYEVSNYARAGRRARHNSAYWRRAPYLGLGPSSHSFDGIVRRWNEREYSAWLERLGRDEDPVAGQEELTAESVAIETAYLGLRTTTGVTVGGERAAVVARWRDEGWATVTGDRAVLTPSGWLRLDALTAALTDVRSR